MSVVLVADDDADIRELLVYKLRQAGYQVIDVADGRSALIAARNAVPDVAIVDVMMPELDGLQVCEMLRVDPRTAQIPVLLLTARAQADDIARGHEAGAAGYLTKPFSPRDLVRRVTDLLAERGQSS